MDDQRDCYEDTIDADVIDIEKIAVSAQEAAAKLTIKLGEVPQVREMRLKRIAEAHVYEIQTAIMAHICVGTRGTVQRSDRESRIRNAITSLHTLDPVKLLIERDAVRGLLLLMSLIGMAAAGTGFYLALPGQRRPPAAVLLHSDERR